MAHSSGWDLWTKKDRLGLARYVSKEAKRWIGLKESAFDVLTNEGRLQLLKAIYNGLLGSEIKYNIEEYSANVNQQVIRSCVDILDVEEREGTCLDLSLLFAGVCIGYRMLPVVVVYRGHAIVLVSMTHDLSRYQYRPERTVLEGGGDGCITTPNGLLELLASGKYLAVECTGFAKSDALQNGHLPEQSGRVTGLMDFDRALLAGREQFDVAERPFIFAIDVAHAHHDLKLQPFSVPYAFHRRILRHLIRGSRWYGAATLVVLLGLVGWRYWESQCNHQADSIVDRVTQSAGMTQIRDAVNKSSTCGHTRAASRIRSMIAAPLRTQGTDEDKDRDGAVRGTGAVALGILGDLDALSTVGSVDYQGSPDSRAWLIHNLPAAQLTTGQVRSLLSNEAPPDLRQAVLLSLVQSDAARLEHLGLSPENVRAQFLDDDDPGVHSAAYLLLSRSFGLAGQQTLEKSYREYRARGSTRLQGRDPKSRHWYVDTDTGIALVYIPRLTLETGDVARMNKIAESITDNPGRQTQIEREFVIGMKEVTRETFARIMELAPPESQPNHPQVASWLEAAAFCLKATKVEANRCYSDAGDWEPGFLMRSGFRMPTEAEWECAARAGSKSHYCFGNTPSILNNFANFNSQSAEQAALRWPNTYGLFDVHGNLAEWTSEVARRVPDAPALGARGDPGVTEEPAATQHMTVKGQSYEAKRADLLFVHRRIGREASNGYLTGFRVAKTVLKFPPE